MKKAYIKPYGCTANDAVGIVPLAAALAGAASIATQLAPAAALVGGYAVGRGIKQAMEFHQGSFSGALTGVIE